MADLANKLRGRHKASVTKIIRNAEELFTTESPDITRLLQIKISLHEKLIVLKGLDAEVFKLVSPKTL